MICPHCQREVSKCRDDEWPSCFCGWSPGLIQCEVCFQFKEEDEFIDCDECAECVEDQEERDRITVEPVMEVE